MGQSSILLQVQTEACIAQRGRHGLETDVRGAEARVKQLDEEIRTMSLAFHYQFVCIHLALTNGMSIVTDLRNTVLI